MENIANHDIQEKILKPISGVLMLIVAILMAVLCIPAFILGVESMVYAPAFGLIVVIL